MSEETRSKWVAVRETARPLQPLPWFLSGYIQDRRSLVDPKHPAYHAALLFVGGSCNRLVRLAELLAQHQERHAETQSTAERPQAPLECTACGQAIGPLHPVDADHAGWMCPKCYAKAQEDE